MDKQLSSNIKLGLFVMSGLLILVSSLYIIGRNKSYFGSSFPLRARFKNVNGLLEGNNVRFSGIQAGTVKRISILNDSTIEVLMFIDKHTRHHIHKNAFVSIGSEGLMGNKIINIEPNSAVAPMVEENDMLVTAKTTDLDYVMQKLDETGSNAAVISRDLKAMVKRLNDSKMIWELLNDTTISENVSLSLANIKMASSRINQVAVTLEDAMSDMKSGKGTLGLLLKDTATSAQLKHGIQQLTSASGKLDGTIQNFNSVLLSADSAINNRNGIVSAVLRDTIAASKFQNSLGNVERGTAAFAEDMEALKHNFLLRGYFKKKDRKSRKASK